MKTLLRTNDPVLISFATAILADNEIEPLVLDSHMSVLEGSLGVLPRRLTVRSEDAFRARAVLRRAGVETLEENEL